MKKNVFIGVGLCLFLSFQGLAWNNQFRTYVIGNESEWRSVWKDWQNAVGCGWTSSTGTGPLYSTNFFDFGLFSSKGQPLGYIYTEGKPSTSNAEAWNNTKISGETGYNEYNLHGWNKFIKQWLWVRTTEMSLLNKPQSPYIMSAFNAAKNSVVSHTGGFNPRALANAVMLNFPDIGNEFYFCFRVQAPDCPGGFQRVCFAYRIVMPNSIKVKNPTLCINYNLGTNGTNYKYKKSDLFWEKISGFQLQGRRYAYFPGQNGGDAYKIFDFYKFFDNNSHNHNVVTEKRHKFTFYIRNGDNWDLIPEIFSPTDGYFRFTRQSPIKNHKIKIVYVAEDISSTSSTINVKLYKEFEFDFYQVIPPGNWKNSTISTYTNSPSNPVNTLRLDTAVFDPVVGNNLYNQTTCVYKQFKIMEGASYNNSNVFSNEVVGVYPNCTASRLFRPYYLPTSQYNVGYYTNHNGCISQVKTKPIVVHEVITAPPKPILDTFYTFPFDSIGKIVSLGSLTTSLAPIPLLFNKSPFFHFACSDSDYKFRVKNYNTALYDYKWEVYFHDELIFDTTALEIEITMPESSLIQRNKVYGENYYINSLMDSLNDPLSHINVLRTQFLQSTGNENISLYNRISLAMINGGKVHDSYSGNYFYGTSLVENFESKHLIYTNNIYETPYIGDPLTVEVRAINKFNTNLTSEPVKYILGLIPTPLINNFESEKICFDNNSVEINAVALSTTTPYLDFDSIFLNNRYMNINSLDYSIVENKVQQYSYSDPNNFKKNNLDFQLFDSVKIYRFNYHASLGGYFTHEYDSKIGIVCYSPKETISLVHAPTFDIVTNAQDDNMHMHYGTPVNTTIANTSYYNSATDTVYWDFLDNSGQYTGEDIWHYLNALGYHSVSATVVDTFGCFSTQTLTDHWHVDGSLPNYTTPPLLSVDDLSTGKVTVFPNPTSGTVFIRGASPKNDAVVIYDVLGNRVSADFVAKEKKIKFLDGTPSGVYFLEFEDDKTGHLVRVPVTKQ